mmetsp:Transcript_22863/g.42947  ORF Transcript_22863/g.42947 Transcript_22863/m.42947 type:complete len:202 (-) Transcript_22863:128-733(-)
MTMRDLSSAWRAGLLRTSMLLACVLLGLKSCSMQLAKHLALRTFPSSSTTIFSNVANCSSTTPSTLFLVLFSLTTILYIRQASVSSELFETAESTVMRIRRTVIKASATGMTLVFLKMSSVRQPASWQTMFLAILMHLRVKLCSSWKKVMLWPMHRMSSSALLLDISSPSGIFAAGLLPNIKTPEMKVWETDESSLDSSQR